MTTPIPDYLIEFVTQSTKIFDDSHNVCHAQAVTKTTHQIMKSLGTPYDEHFVSMVAMLHDVCDHKYPESIKRSELSDFIKLHLSDEQAKYADLIIDNVSYSKEAKGLRENLPEPYNTYLTALSDADRLEAIGKIGIVRCETFTREHGGKVPDDVIKHCHEKLLRLLPDGFIKTEYGRKLAEPLHQEIVDYVAFYSTD
jgi:uncharacterized protein